MNKKLNDSAIREAAYYIWQNAGCPTGQESYHWALAVEQLSNNKLLSSSKSSKAALTSKSLANNANKTAAKKATATTAKKTSKK